ncbi:hypothetical protein [Paracoccus sp. SSJ]|uniref:hypothetical protein n=1 Tax=Paracoccus sp. SSJ TaxID=3050636 RepID=UPI00254BAC8F|nr:hypothetical protein [Paracoccus sp. SSJ]MDK8872364.1 hypothetical protein [Paracoccus sp. SSJ]
MMPRRALAASLALCLAALPALAELNDRPPNARGQEPAFPGQTRAAEIDQQIPISRTPLIRGSAIPGAWRFCPMAGC